jgi:outer membrane protein assembly factor BamB
VWEALAATGSAVTASPALANINGTDMVLIGSTNGLFYAFDAQSGTQVTQQPFQAGAAIRSSAAVSSNGSIIFGADNGVLYALQIDIELGFTTPFATFQSGGAITSSPAIGKIDSTNDAVYYTSTDGSLVCVTVSD